MNILYALLFQIPAWIIKAVMDIPLITTLFVFAWLLRLVILPRGGMWLSTGCWIVSILLFVSCIAVFCDMFKPREIEA